MMYRSTFFATVARRSFVAGLLALAALLALGGLARAEDTSDPPRVQQAGGYNIEYLGPQSGKNVQVGTEAVLRFRVSDAKGQPAAKLSLNLTAIRDYSGQVTKEHNGPRTPNIGPMPLAQVSGAPGEYQASVKFGDNGHWIIQVDSPSFSDKIKFRQPVEAAEDQGAGINFDWLLWPGILLTVATIVMIVGRKGEIFPTPADELEPPIQAPANSSNSKIEPESLAASGSNKS